MDTEHKKPDISGDSSRRRSGIAFRFDRVSVALHRVSVPPHPLATRMDIGLAGDWASLHRSSVTPLSIKSWTFGYGLPDISGDSSQKIEKPPRKEWLVVLEATLYTLRDRR